MAALDRFATFSATGRPLISTTMTGLPAAVDGADEVVLPSGEIEAGARAALAHRAAQPRNAVELVAHHHDGDVGLAGVGGGFVQEFLLPGGGRVVEDLGVGPLFVEEIGALGIQHAHLAGEARLQHVAHGGGGHVAGAVAAHRMVRVVGVGTADGDGRDLRRVERQQVVVVLQQHQALAGGLPGHGQVGGVQHHRIGRIQGAVRTVEEALAHLHAQNLAHPGIQHRHRHPALADQFAQRQNERAGLLEVGAHVHPGEDRLAHGVLQIGGHVVLAVEILHGVAVGHHVSLKAHAPAQHVDQKVGTAGHGDAVVVVVGAHHAQRVGGADHPFVRPQVQHFHLPRRDLGIGAGLALARALVIGIHREVLHGGDHALRLNAANFLDGQFGDQEGILAVGFQRAAPARIAQHVHDGRIDVVVAQGESLAPGDFAHLADQGAIPGGAHGQLRGEGSGMQVLDAADALIGEFRGDAEAGVLDEEPLHFVERPGVLGCRPHEGHAGRVGSQLPVGIAVQVLVDVGDAVLPQIFGAPVFGGQIVGHDAVVSVERGALHGLFVQGHPGNEVVQALVLGLGGVLVDVLAAVLIEVDPAVVVDILARDHGLGGPHALVVGRRVEQRRRGGLRRGPLLSQHRRSHQADHRQNPVTKSHCLLLSVP